MSAWRVADPTARLTDPDAAEAPRETTFAAAQPAVNFVVLEPGWLPADCTLEGVTVRPEQPPGRPEGVTAEALGQSPWSDGNPSTVRAVVEGDDRRLRLKQFLYDTAPPSASVAPLWGTPEPTPVEVGESAATVGWLGTDYKDNRGACVQRDRTQVELSVLAGSFDDAELAGVLDGLERAAPEAARAVDRAPFHRLNYWVRYGLDPEPVPHGLWDADPARPYGDAEMCSRSALTRLAIGDGASVEPLLAPGERFLLDSAAAFPSAEAVECVFRHRANGSDHLWLQAAAPESPLAIDRPPAPSDQPAATREPVDLRGTTVHYAALTEADGAWEAVWTENGVQYAAWAGASTHLDGAAFRDAIASLVAP